jgi:hypothetical protein
MMGQERAQYAMGVTGSGQRQTIQVIRAEGGDGCFTANARSQSLQQRDVT